MKAGTLIRLADGRMGRVVYNGLDGVGIKFGAGPVDIETIMRGDSGLFENSPHDDELAKWAPEAMLRDPYSLAIKAGLECVGKRGEGWFVVDEDEQPMSLATEMSTTLAKRRPDLAAELRAIHEQNGPEASAWQKRANANFARMVSECEVIELQEPNMNAALLHAIREISIRANSPDGSRAAMDRHLTEIADICADALAEVNFEWVGVLGEYRASFKDNDGEGPYGSGKTKEAAHKDLLEQRQELLGVRGVSPAPQV